LKITAFCGSPRRGGNSEIILDWATSAILANGHNIQIFRPDSLKFSPCLNCGGCNESGECVINDDMAQVYSAIRDSDRFLICSPIFFFGLPAQIKAVIDRCQALWVEKYLLKRPIPDGNYVRKGLVILVGGLKMKVGFDCGGACATAFYRSISVPEHETISFEKIDDKGAIIEHPDALSKVRHAALNLIK